MRENRTYGSEGGEAKSLPYPYRGLSHRNVTTVPLADMVAIAYIVDRTSGARPSASVGHSHPARRASHATDRDPSSHRDFGKAARQSQILHRPARPAAGEEDG